MISATGPTSRDLVQGLTDLDLSSLGYFRFHPEPVQVGGVQATVLRTGFSGELGFELVTDPASAPALWQALIEAGGKPFGLEAIDIARVEAGLIIIALDYQPGETSPYDVSLDRFVKQGTENVGSEALAAVGANPPKRLKTLTIEGDAAPEAGTAVTKDGDEVGTVTSPVISPRLGAIALAVLDTGAATDGEKVEVGGAVATVAAAQPVRPGEEAPARLSARGSRTPARVSRPGAGMARTVSFAAWRTGPWWAWCRTSARDAVAEVIDAIVERAPGARGPCRLRGGRPRPQPSGHDGAGRSRGRARERDGRRRRGGAADRHVRAPRRSSADGRGRRDPVHAGARRDHGRVRLAGTRLRPRAGGDAGRPGLPVRPGRAVARSSVAGRGPQGRVRGPARRRRPRRASARLRSARDRACGSDGGRGPQAARRVQRLPRRDRRGGGQGDRARRARVVGRPARRPRDRVRACPSAAASSRCR